MNLTWEWYDLLFSAHILWLYFIWGPLPSRFSWRGLNRSACGDIVWEIGVRLRCYFWAFNDSPSINKTFVPDIEGHDGHSPWGPMALEFRLVFACRRIGKEKEKKEGSSCLNYHLMLHVYVGMCICWDSENSKSSNSRLENPIANVK